MPKGSEGYTLIELVVVCCVLSVLAAISVPGLAGAHGRASVGSAAASLAVALRDAQARAWATGQPVRVSLTDDGRAFVVESGEGAGLRRLGTGSFGGARCTSNYPGGAVEFAPAGYPHVPGGGVRAGTFTVACFGLVRRVVVQMGGAVRCR